VCHEERVESAVEEKATAVQEQKKPGAEADGVQPSVGEIREGAGAQTRRPSEEAKPEQAEVALLFRCVRCKQAAHYEHR
jgi:hypothetical protein